MGMRQIERASPGEILQMVAYVGLRNPDGTYQLSVPLYIRVKDVNKSGISEQQEELIHRISEIMVKRYEKQISEHFAIMKRRKEEDEKI